ncbi:MAG: hypothetical protein RBT86_06135, partial [Azospira sp.]|nr:hypothetical protein [Azospira sp.]
QEIADRQRRVQQQRGGKGENETAGWHDRDCRSRRRGALPDGDTFWQKCAHRVLGRTVEMRQ